MALIALNFDERISLSCAMYALSAVVLPAKLYFLLNPEAPEAVREITLGILKESLEYAVKTHKQIIRDDS